MTSSTVLARAVGPKLLLVILVATLLRDVVLLNRLERYVDDGDVGVGAGGLLLSGREAPRTTTTATLFFRCQQQQQHSDDENRNNNSTLSSSSSSSSSVSPSIILIVSHAVASESAVQF